MAYFIFWLMTVLLVFVVGPLGINYAEPANLWVYIGFFGYVALWFVAFVFYMRADMRDPEKRAAFESMNDFDSFFEG